MVSFLATEPIELTHSSINCSATSENIILSNRVPAVICSSRIREKVRIEWRMYEISASSYIVEDSGGGGLSFVQGVDCVMNRSDASAPLRG